MCNFLLTGIPITRNNVNGMSTVDQNYDIRLEFLSKSVAQAMVTRNCKTNHERHLEAIFTVSASSSSKSDRTTLLGLCVPAAALTSHFSIMDGCLCHLLYKKNQISGWYFSKVSLIHRFFGVLGKSTWKNFDGLYIWRKTVLKWIIQQSPTINIFPPF